MSPCEPPTAQPFRHTTRVYWEDTDAGGIVYYANYLKFFERARTEWLRSLGVEQGALRERLGAMFIVSRTAMRYLRPARLDDLLEVTVAVRDAARVSLHLEQQALARHGTAGRRRNPNRLRRRTDASGHAASPTKC